MTLLDRIIAGSLSLGIWVWILMSLLSPVSLHALSNDPSDVKGLRSFVGKVVKKIALSTGLVLAVEVLHNRGTERIRLKGRGRMPPALQSSNHSKNHRILNTQIRSWDRAHTRCSWGCS